MKSMTGYALCEASENGVHVKLEIKSVNSKGLDLRIRMHESLGELEFKLSSLVRKTISRGKIYLRVDYNFTDEQGAINVNWDNLKTYSKIADKIQNLTLCEGKNTPLDFLRLPEILKTEPDEELKIRISDVIFSQMDVLFDKFDKSREKEGQELLNFFTGSVEDINRKVKEIRDFKDEHVLLIRKKLTDRIKEFKEIDFESKRLEEEILYYVEKSDITEELVRLESHIELLKSEFKKERTGKKIDFILQEINREVNTIASKSQSIEITTNTIYLKEIVSKMREQVANIE